MAAKAKKKSRQPTINPSLYEYYSEGNEKDRLIEHRLEKDRTFRILKRFLPPAPATIFDVGGATGVYAFPLAKAGYDVHLMDPIPLHIKQAKEEAKKSKCQLASYSVGDARNIERENNSADVVLFFGPLYHLTAHEDRIQALSEAYRVLKPTGLLFAVAIARFASLMDAMYKETLYSKLKIIEDDFATGVHKKISKDITFAYLHHPSDLKKEILKSGFQDITLRSIEGPVWEKQILKSLQRDAEGWEKLLDLLEKIETEEAIIGASAHIMAIAHVGNSKQ